MGKLNYNINHNRTLTNLYNKSYDEYHIMRLKQKPTGNQKKFVNHMLKLLSEQNIEPVIQFDETADRYTYTLYIKRLLYQCRQNNINTSYQN